jgi:hypothetical protein
MARRTKRKKRCLHETTTKTLLIENKMKITIKKLRNIILQEMRSFKRGSTIGPYETPEDFQPEESTLSWVPGKHYIELVEASPGRYRIDVYVGQPNGGMLFSGGYPKRSLFNSKKQAVKFYESALFSRILRKKLIYI